MLRTILFWIHLAAGVVAGAVIAIMCFTGAVLAFEHEIVEWAERDARRVSPPAEGGRRPLDELVAAARAAKGEGVPSAVTVAVDPAAAVAVSFGRETTYFVDPYTAQARQPASTSVHDFMHRMVEWHRWLATSGDQRPVGKAVTGACNAAFLLLGLTGLYLWWPRQWIRRVVRPAIWFVSARGKARDWNWHNVVGFWALPVLIVLTASGMVISYRWASDSVYRLLGEQPPTQAGPGVPAGAAVQVPTPGPGARPTSLEGLFASAQAAVPHWETMTLRLGGAPRTGGRVGTERSGGSEVPAALTLLVRELDRFPSFASTTLALDPFSGDVLQQTRFSDSSRGRQARLWLRWLHVGQGFGWGGQLIALVACLGGLVLVYTGYALALRRLVRRRAASGSVQSAPAKHEPSIREAGTPL